MVLRFGHKQLGLRGKHIYDDVSSIPQTLVQLSLSSCLVVFFFAVTRKSVLRALLTWLASVLQRHDGPDHHGDWNDAVELATYPAAKQPEGTQKRGFMAAWQQHKRWLSMMIGSFLNCQFVLLDVLGKSHDFLVFEFHHICFTHIIQFCMFGPSILQNGREWSYNIRSIGTLDVWI